MRFFAPILAAASLALVACGGPKQGVVPKISDDDITMGSATATVEVIEYAAASCPHCANFARDAFPELKAKYLDTGKARYTLREVILNENDSYGLAGFLLAHCAGEERYHAVLDAVFQGQTLARTSPMRDVLLQIAQSIGMTEEQFTTCVSDQKAGEEFMKKVQENLIALGDHGTPAFFVNGVYVDGGATEAEYGQKVQQAIEEALKK